MQWLCSQIGAREHYAIPRALHKNGKLGALYTDFWASSSFRSAGKHVPFRRFRGLVARYHPDLASAHVHSWNYRSFAYEAMARSRWSLVHGLPHVLGPYGAFIEVGKMFAVRVRDALNHRQDVSPDSLFFAYDTGALETMEWCHERNNRCVLNQMDPNRVEVDLVREETKRWPEWQAQSLEVPEEYFRRREQEWALADKVVVNSEFSRQALMRQGVSPDKLVIIPLCYELGQLPERKGHAACKPSLKPSTINYDPLAKNRTRIHVLFLGQVILRKGIQYLIQAARFLQGEPVQFDVVGPIGISPDAVASAPANVRFHGRAARDQAAAWYTNADVFVLPTLSDGFAITQVEAMAYGLPVIATPNCGAVVTNELDGFIIPPRDPKALAEAILRYTDAELLRSHKTAALVKSRQFTLDHLAANLLKLETSLH